MENLFAYGTLMSDEIMREVSGCHLASVPGEVTGFRRRAVKGEHYPGLVPEAGCRVEGVVYLRVPAAAWERLDRFEGEMYARQLVTVVLSNGVTVPAATYVVQPRFRDALEQHDWDFAAFLLNGKASFQRHYHGYQALATEQRPKP